MAETGHGELSWAFGCLALPSEKYIFPQTQIYQNLMVSAVELLRIGFGQSASLNRLSREDRRLKNHAYINEISKDVPPGTPARYLRGGKFLFAAYGCALLERQTEKGRVYIAVNLKSGRAKAICRGTEPLDEAIYPRIAARIRASSIRGAGRNEVDVAPGKWVKRDKLLQALSHIFTNILPKYGYTVRKNQIELAEHILATIAIRGISLAESAVGTGKTHAYLVAAVLAKRGRINDFWLQGHYPGQSYIGSTQMPVVIATSSIALQRALVKDYIPLLSKILVDNDIIRERLSCVVRKGKEHFLCEKRLQIFGEDADEQTKLLLRNIMEENTSCDLADSERLTPYIKKRICVTGKCEASCQYASRCRYMRYLSAANNPKVDIQITNHNYFLADILHRNNGKRPLIPDYQLVVIDEAHKFLQAARQMYGVELSTAEITALADNIRDIMKDNLMIQRTKKLAGQGMRLFKRMQESIPSQEDDERERFPATLDKETQRYLKNIAGIAQELMDEISGSSVPLRFRDHKSQVLWNLERMGGTANTLRGSNGLISWVEYPKNDSGVVLCGIPKDLDEKLCHDIWDTGIPTVLTSGTLSAGGNFGRVKQSLGICRVNERRLLETSKPSPFDYRNNSLLYFSEQVPFPDHHDKGYIAAVADEIEKLIRASNGHAAVLFTSYNVMGLVYAVLQRRFLPYHIFRMGKRDINALGKFRQSGNGILFAAGALWEGIDIPGDTLSMLIIVKLPFAAPDPIGDYEKAMLGGMQAYKAKALVPDMLVKLKQGFGRLIRTETDTGVCAILDCRAKESGAYHRHVLNALPACRVTSSIREVDRFMQKQKDGEYFLAE